MCTHCWKIETPDGPTSWGECKYCKERREFPNVFNPEFNRPNRTIPKKQGSPAYSLEERELNKFAKDEYGHYITEFHHADTMSTL